jgi:hypothetical protein
MTSQAGGHAFPHELELNVSDTGIPLMSRPRAGPPRPLPGGDEPSATGPVIPLVPVMPLMRPPPLR